MAGLMPNMQSNAEAAPEPGPKGVIPEANYGADEEQPNVEPEEQAQYDKFMDNAFKLIYDEKTLPGLLDRIKSAEDPAEALAAITASVAMRLEDSAKEAGAPLSADVLFQGGKEILEDVADLATTAGAHEFTDDELESALYQALDLYRETRSQAGQLDDNAIQQDMGMLVEADARGDLTKHMPELGERFGKGGE